MTYDTIDKDEPTLLYQRVQARTERVQALMEDLRRHERDSKVWHYLIDLLAVEVLKDDPQRLLLLGAKVHDYSVSLNDPDACDDDEEDSCGDKDEEAEDHG